jgi:hypothetical protein
MQITRPPAWLMALLALAAARALWNAPGLKNGKSTMILRVVLTALPMIDSIYFAYLQLNPHSVWARAVQDYVLAFGLAFVIVVTAWQRFYLSEVVRQAEVNAAQLSRVMQERDELRARLGE